MREQTNLGHSPRVERELEALFSIPAPDAAFVARLERQLVAQGISQSEKDNAKASPPWVQLLGRRRWAAVALGLLLVLAVAVIAIGPQQVWAGLQRLLGYVPGLGFVNLERAYLLVEQVEVSRDGATLRVEQVVASPDRTIVEISSSIQPGPEITWYEIKQAYHDFQAFLHLPDGSKLELTAKAMRRGEGTLAFPPLPADTEIEQVTLELPRLPLLPAGAAPEDWVVPLNLRPVTEEVVADFDVQVYALSDASDTHEGITLRVLEVAQGPEETSLHVQVEWGPEIGWVRPLPLQPGYGNPARLRDSRISYPMRDLHDDSPVEFHDPRVLFGPQACPISSTMTTYENMWTFGPLWSSPQSLTLQVDWFIVFTSTTEMSFAVELGDDPQVGDRWPLDVHLMANGFPVHITSVELADPSADDYGPDAAWKLIFEAEPVPEREGGGLLESIWLGVPLEDYVLARGSRTGIYYDRPQSYVILKALPEDPVPIRVSGVGVRVSGPWIITWAIPGADGVGK